MAEEQAATAEQKPRSKKLWFILIGVVILGGAGALGYRMVFPAGPTKSHPGSDSQQEAAAQATGKMSDVKSTLTLDSFLVNLADKEDMRFVKAQFQLGMAEPAAELPKDPVILAATRDAIISLLSAKRSDEILTPEGKQELRKEIRNRVNAILPKGKVNEVYIVDFVVQL